MADEKMNDKEDEQCDQQSQASKETTSPSNPVPVEEDPVTEAPETDQQAIQNRRSSSPTDEEVEPEGKRPRYAGGSLSDSNLDLPDLIKRLMSGIESWLHSHFTEYITLPPTTLSIPGAPNPFRPPKPFKPPKPPKHPGPKLTSSSVLDRLQKLEAEVNSLKHNLQETTESTEDLLLEAVDYQSRIKNLEAEVNKLKGGSDDLQADLVDNKLKAKVNYSSESEITTDEKSCSAGGTIRRISSVDAEMLCAMLLRRIKSGPGSTSGKDDQPHKPPAGDGFSASKKGKNKAIMIEYDGSQVETKDVITYHDELKMDDNTSLDEMEDITSRAEMVDAIISQDEMKDDYTCQDEMKDANTSQDEMKDDNAPVDEMKDDNALVDEMKDANTSHDEMKDDKASQDEMKDDNAPGR